MKLIVVISFLLMSLNLIANDENYITIFVAPSAHEIDWESPNKLYSSISTSMNKAGSYSTGVGHGMFEFNCLQENGNRIKLTSSYNGSKWGKKAAWSIKLKQEGLKVLFEDLSAGYFTEHLETRTFLYRFLGRKENALNGDPIRLNPSFFKMHVSQKQCSDAFAFYTFFQKNHMKFGFFGDPYEQFVKLKDKKDQKQTISGGCTPFLSGLVKTVGYWDEVFDSKWIRKLNVSENWIGGLDKETGEKKKVNLMKRIKSDGDSWYEGNEKTRSGKFADPELMWDFIDEASYCLTRNPGANINDCTDLVDSWVNRKNITAANITVNGKVTPYLGVEIKP